MSSNTKIVVLRSKELVYALVLLIVSVLIIMVAVSLFMPPKNDTAAPAVPPQNVEEESPSGTDVNTTSSPAIYVPGIYSSTLQLGNSNVELQITVDKDHINSINLANIDESIETLYPLMGPTLEELSAAILAQQSIEGINYTEDNRYTSMLLMQAITETLDKARASENADSPETSVIY